MPGEVVDDGQLDGARTRHQKRNIKPWNLPVSHTTCYGELTEAKSGKLVSRSVTYFRLKTLPSFLWSFRLNRT